MVQAIGIDTVDIARFANWAEYPAKKLLRIFSPEEINYCLSVPIKSAERFAGRFAAKEALFKAFCQQYPERTTPFVTFCRAVTVLPTGHGPEVRINRGIIQEELLPRVSITHTAQVCTAIALLGSP